MKTLFNRIKKFLWKLVKPTILSVGLIAVPAFAQSPDLSTSSPVTGNTPLTILSNGPNTYVVTSVYFKNTQTTNATFWLYDSTGNGTNYVSSNYVSYATVSTNWVNVFTNATGIIITNTFTGIATVGTTNALSTNELPRRLQRVVLASGDRTIETVIQPVRGLTIYSTMAGLVELIYHKVP